MEKGPRASEPQPGFRTEREQAIISEIDTFVRNPELVTLAGISGLHFTENMDTQARLIELKALAGSNWEFRKGSERPVEDASETLEDQQRTQALKVAESLHMKVEAQFQDRTPDAGIVLGSGGRHAFERTRHAMGDTQYIFAGDASFNTQAITNTRKKEDLGELKRDERKEYYDQKLFSLAQQYRDNLPEQTRVKLSEKYEGTIPEDVLLANVMIPEKEFMQAAIEANYGEKQPDGTFSLEANYNKETQTVEDAKDGKTFKTQITRYRYKGDNPTNPNELVFMEIPSRTEGKRVSAEDCYQSLRQVLPTDTKKVAVSTTQLFSPFQHFDALRLLPGIDNETTGFSTTATSFDTPAKYLQEITSTINAAQKLHDSLAK